MRALPIALALLAAPTLLPACGARSSRAERDETTGGSERAAPPPTSAEPSQPTQIIASTAPPTLSEAQIASDAADPALVVDPSSAWVVVPSFRIAIQMPEGWYWTNADELIAQGARTGQTLGSEAEADLRRGLQAAANRWREGDTEHAGHLIPSARVLLGPGGLPRGARLQPDACDALLLPQLRQLYPDARATRGTTLQIAGRESARCTITYTVPAPHATMPASSEVALIFGESHVIMIASVGAPEDPVADVLDAMLASIRPL